MYTRDPSPTETILASAGESTKHPSVFNTQGTPTDILTSFRRHQEIQKHSSFSANMPRSANSPPPYHPFQTISHVVCNSLHAACTSIDTCVSARARQYACVRACMQNSYRATWIPTPAVTLRISGTHLMFESDEIPSNTTVPLGPCRCAWVKRGSHQRAHSSVERSSRRNACAIMRLRTNDHWLDC